MKKVYFANYFAIRAMAFFFITGCTPSGERGTAGSGNKTAVGRRGRSSEHIASHEAEGRQQKELTPPKGNAETPRTEWEVEDKTGVEKDRKRETPSRTIPDRQALIAEFRTKSRELRSCYEKGLRVNPKLEGKVLVDIVVGKTGKVEKAEIVERGTTLHAGKGTPQVIEGFLVCIRKSLKDLNFSSLKDVVWKIRYPFVFRPNRP
jgi:hypothetical protein